MGKYVLAASKESVVNKFIIFCFFFLLCCEATAQEKEYYLKEAPPIGSHIKFKTAISPIPFDKTYDELSSSEKAIFRSNYEDLPEDCEPPYPINGMGEISKEIVKAQKKLLARGELFAIALVSKDGLVQTVSVYKTPSKNMTKIVSIVLFKTKFKPAICAGSFSEMEFPFISTFKVDY